VKVLGAKTGDRLKVGVINGHLGHGTVVSVERKSPFRVELALKLVSAQVVEPPIDLLLALPRPIMLKRIFSQVTTLGIGTFYLIHARRVEKSFWNSSLLQEEQYRFQLVQGLEQAVATRLPRVQFHQRFKPFVEDILPGIRANYSHLLLAHPGGRNTLVQTVKTGPGRILLAVGPEGGWVEYERQKLKEQGFQTISMGERILKVDTAVIALHSQISLVLQMRGDRG